MKNKKIILKPFDSNKTYPDGRYIVKTFVTTENPMLCNHLNIGHNKIDLWTTDDGIFVKPAFLCRVNIIFGDE